MTRTIEELLSQTVADGDCLRWTGYRTSTGYGRIGFKGKSTGVHRVMYELVHGEEPVGLDVDHSCFVRDCINPDHLEAVTHRENLLRSARAGRNVLLVDAPPTCSQGHERTPENRVFYKGRDVECRVCRTRVVACDVCGAELVRTSLKRHLKNVHGEVADR